MWTCFVTLYKIYEFLFLVNRNQIKLNTQFDINLSATNSKKSAYYTHKMFLPKFLYQKLGVHIIHTVMLYTTNLYVKCKHSPWVASNTNYFQVVTHLITEEAHSYLTLVI